MVARGFGAGSQPAQSWVIQSPTKCFPKTSEALYILCAGASYPECNHQGQSLPTREVLYPDIMGKEPRNKAKPGGVDSFRVSKCWGHLAICQPDHWAMAAYARAGEGIQVLPGMETILGEMRMSERRRYSQISWETEKKRNLGNSLMVQWLGYWW